MLLTLYRGTGGPQHDNNSLARDSEWIEWWTTDREVAAQYGPTVLIKKWSTECLHSVIDANGAKKNMAITRTACVHGYRQRQAGIAHENRCPLVIVNIIDDPEHEGSPVTLVGFPKPLQSDKEGKSC